MNTVQGPMLFREKPNDPVSPDFRPGLLVKQAPGPEGRVRTSRRRSAKKKSHDAMFFVNTAGRVSTIGRRPAKKRAEDRHPPVWAARRDVFREHRC